MNLLFLTIGRIDNISSHGIYKDLMQKFRNEGHSVYIATPTERRYKDKTRLVQNGNVQILMIKTLNLQKTNVIEKGLATLLIEHQFLIALKKHFSTVRFDMILYSTPPISFTRAINYVKNKDKAISYLLLKDIFPQNAVDLGMIRQGGILHRYFRKKETSLYTLSDHIGCMSQANVDFIRKHNPDINPGKLEVNPNSIEPEVASMGLEQKVFLRMKYKIPLNATVFIYGGNLGKPQGIDFLLETLNSQKNKVDVYFIVSGSGTEFSRIKNWFSKRLPMNALLLSALTKKEFNDLLQVCDVGMIFLDKRFTIPNFPSRLLSYLEFKLPVIAATDKNTDLGKILQENDFGFWSEAGNIENINNNITKLSKDPDLRLKMGQNGYNYLLKNYTISHSYETIIRHLKHENSP